ncbi:MAG: hypothetical protein R3D98_17620 [Candidatus Krumholzibacteriia bacterium]
MVIRPVLTPGLVLVLGSLLAAPALAGGIVGDKHPHPDDRALVHRGTVIPCDPPRATVALAAGDEIAFADTTTGAGAVPSYGCRAWDESGPEHVYRLELATDLVVDAWLDGNAIDHDLILLDACDSDACLTQQNTEFSAWLSAGSYILVVDGYEGAAGAYTLNLSAREPGLPTAVCTGPDTVDLGTLQGGASLDDSGSLFDRPDLVSVWDCAVTATRGGERWYRVTLPADDQTYDDGTDVGTMRLDLVAAATSPGLDLALWIFDGCGLDATCLAFVDVNPAGGSEELRLLNDESTPLTVYVGVDCTAPPDSLEAGRFTLTTGGTVAVERRSLGDIRSLFR